MALLKVVLYPDDPLTQVSDPYDSVGPALVRLADDMLETMQVHEGVGLAAPQVGIARRMFVMQEPEKEPRCLINPEILFSEGHVLGEEGCLSLPALYYDGVPRAEVIRVRALDLAGELTEFEARDFEARIIQHELDHLDGIVFLDRLDVLTRQSLLTEWEALRARSMAES